MLNENTKKIIAELKENKFKAEYDSIVPKSVFDLDDEQPEEIEPATITSQGEELPLFDDYRLRSMTIGGIIRNLLVLVVITGLTAFGLLILGSGLEMMGIAQKAMTEQLNKGVY